MSTNISLDERLVEEARRLGRYKTRQGALTAALKEYIKYRRQLAIIDQAGKIDFDATYDCTGESRRRR